MSGKSIMAIPASSTWQRLAIAAAAAASLAAPADAQVLLRSPQQIAHCLCQNRVVDERRVALDQEWRVYEEARQRYAALEGQVDSIRGTMNVHDREQIEAFQRLLDQRDAAVRTFQDQATPAYNAAVERYNTAVDVYNGSCADAVFDPIVLAEVQRGLYCPR
jgi:TolA-binding protein